MIVDSGNRTAIHPAGSSTGCEKRIWRIGAALPTHFVVSTLPIEGTRTRRPSSCSQPTSSSSILSKVRVLPFSPEATTAIGTVRIPVLSFSRSTAYPKSRRADTWGSHISESVVMTPDNSSVRPIEGLAANSGCAFRKDLFQRLCFSGFLDDKLEEEGTVVFVTPV